MDLKRVLLETADRFESGALGWTKRAYARRKDEDTRRGHFAITPDMSPEDYCFCAVGGCTIVGLELGEVDPEGLHSPVMQVENALDMHAPDVNLPYFNDKYALSAKSVAEKLRKIAERL